MAEIVEKREEMIEKIAPNAIVFAEYSALCDQDGNKLPMSVAVHTQYDEYSEIPYRRGELIRDYGFQGPRVLVGAYKSALLHASMRRFQLTDTPAPMHIEHSIMACEAAAPFDLSGVDKIPYIPHPKYHSSDKSRLAFRPDFDLINELYDPSRPDAWAICRAFYESLYAVQKFAAGVREDVYGGSGFVPPQLSWEDRGKEPDLKLPEVPNDRWLRLAGRSFLKKIWRSGEV